MQGVPLRESIGSPPWSAASWFVPFVPNPTATVGHLGNVIFGGICITITAKAWITSAIEILVDDHKNSVIITSRTENFKRVGRVSL